MSQLKDKLRLQIEERHAKALEALHVLADYLDDASLTNGTPPVVTQASNQLTPPAAKGLAPARRRKRNGSESFRERILAIVKLEWATVGGMAERTGLTIQQVRGVLSAPNLAEQIEKRNSANGMEYHLRPEAET
jgi:predicted Rossmann fold nucleotide-binding protein DprA/Smf involved in DNA uptake